jgi:cytidine deaminase
VHAVSEGVRAFTAIGVATHESARTGSPCGACRQFLSEFGLALRVVYLREGEVVAEPLSALLPAAFELRG